MHLSVWVGQGSIPKDTLSDGAANAPHGTAPVKLTGEFKHPAERNFKIHRARPSVHAPAESPKLVAVISSGAYRTILSIKRSVPRKSCGVCRLPRVFAPPGIAMVQ